jgi:hypothetical protein
VRPHVECLERRDLAAIWVIPTSSHLADARRQAEREILTTAPTISDRQVLAEVAAEAAAAAAQPIRLIPPPPSGSSDPGLP